MSWRPGRTDSSSSKSGGSSIFKSGWHPEGKGGGKESWRGDFKGINQVAGWMGKSRDKPQEKEEHMSTPLSSLKDPSSFGPPPKHINYHGAAAMPHKTTPDKSGWGAPMSQEELQAMEEEKRQREEAERLAEEEANKPPPGPYKRDTTGLNTSHLPPPPVRRLDRGDGSGPASATVQRAPPPKLPPRLPPRQNEHPDEFTPPPPPSYSESVAQPPATKSYLNQGAMDKLGRAGVSVPGFNIGRTASPPIPARSPSTTLPPPTSPLGTDNGQFSELQARFKGLSTRQPSTTETPSAGTTFAQKQAALKTAQSFRNDPASVSLADARSAAFTANNFRERHGEQVAQGWKTANGFNQKHGVVNRLNGYAGGSQEGVRSPPIASSPTTTDMPVNLVGSLGKKPPPPPPPKKKELGGVAVVPPPVPLGSKPRPS
ncbi:hypothetical protein M501DRAFT_926044 [Patellaria atrata CBS 101060]|uniref:Uncharacterized protein n=1 Tax=Patellaria atrata CBS 101060 TaxID=1346257 RepID=A0A9P4SIX6_9PEZI|nr:hypothetical protein M501DRAFT_926044 [Patellaria atrata CBS 101060]